MSGEREELVAAVAAAMDAAYDFSNYRWPQQEDCPRIADLLMPVVDRIAKERAAAELDRVTDIASANWPAARTLIKYRAAALRAMSGEATA